ncbi:unnamed protein product [Mycena citricolor]|uniref:MPN domain-containing protein n=1 Tax=Mycena citricolor TaxID=2018698 RepID=A0AAD2HKQ8_9AGAR|nr:unnamed protein product [Mycena citricolor]
MPPIRPSSISELAAEANDERDIAAPRDASLKYYLRRADQHRREALALVDGAGRGPTATNPNGSDDLWVDMEAAFIQFVRAISTIIDKIPKHKDYMSELSETQRKNLETNGHTMLDNLSRIKTALVDRYEKYLLSENKDPNAVPVRLARKMAAESRTNPVQGTQPPPHRSQTNRAMADEAAAWRKQREEAQRMDQEMKASWAGPSTAISTASGAAAAAVAAARAAASTSTPTLGNGYFLASASASGAPARIPYAPQQHAPPGASLPVSLMGSHGHPMVSASAQAQARLASVPPSLAGRAQASPTYSVPPMSYPSSSGVSFPVPSTSAQQPVASTSRTSPIAGPSYNTLPATYNALHAKQFVTPGPMPLRPLRVDDSDGDETDRESMRSGWRAGYSVPRNALNDLASGIANMDLGAFLSVVNSQLKTDSSPAGSTSKHVEVAYPSLARSMTVHQKEQGYVPASSVALDAARTAANASTAAPASYSTSFAAPAVPPLPRELQRSNTLFERDQRQAQALSEQRERERKERERERERADADMAQRLQAEEQAAAGGKPRLKTCVLPKRTIDRFLAIATVNTSRNMETCGLLLGREIVRESTGRARFVIETLLIPKQHATSDTCTMDEEEMVLMFTEERGLITLGWIHTHPTQSCFMSSVDVHTHASFQRMLPESFAVVCAPKHEPNFGIFRLTDPPGLETVLSCTAREAFHPHPDVPIYTDADRGHVLLSDGQLEIVDLR